MSVRNDLHSECNKLSTVKIFGEFQNCKEWLNSYVSSNGSAEMWGRRLRAAGWTSGMRSMVFGAHSQQNKWQFFEVTATIDIRKQFQLHFEFIHRFSLSPIDCYAKAFLMQNKAPFVRNQQKHKLSSAIVANDVLPQSKSTHLTADEANVNASARMCACWLTFKFSLIMVLPNTLTSSVLVYS